MGMGIVSRCARSKGERAPGERLDMSRFSCSPATRKRAEDRQDGYVKFCFPCLPVLSWGTMPQGTWGNVLSVSAFHIVCDASPTCAGRQASSLSTTKPSSCALTTQPLQKLLSVVCRSIAQPETGCLDMSRFASLKIGCRVGNPLFQRLENSPE